MKLRVLSRSQSDRASSEGDNIRCVVVVRPPVPLRAAAKIKQCHLAVSSQLLSVLAQITVCCSTREI